MPTMLPTVGTTRRHTSSPQKSRKPSLFCVPLASFPATTGYVCLVVAVAVRIRGGPVGVKNESPSENRGDRELASRSLLSRALLPRACRLKPQALVRSRGDEQRLGR